MPARSAGPGGVEAGTGSWPGPHAAVRSRYMAGAGALRTLRMVLVVVVAMSNVSGITGNVIRSKDAAQDSPALQGPSQTPSRRPETRLMAGRRSRTPPWSPADARQERSAGLFRPGEPKLLTSHGYTLVINSITFAVEATNASDPKDGIFVTTGHPIGPGDSVISLGPLKPANLSMTIRSKATDRYVCMNATGHLYSSTVREESGDCDFKEGIVPHFYSTFCSVYHPNASNPHVKRRWLGREWCIGIGKKGQILPGHKSSKNDSTSHFTKRQVKDDSIVWSSITFPIPVTEPVTPSVTAPRNRDRDRDRDSRECEETLPQRPFDRTSSGGMRSRPSNRRKNRRCRKNKKKDRRRSKKKKPCDNLFNVNCENSRRRSKSHRRRNRRRKVNRDGLFDNDARSIR